MHDCVFCKIVAKEIPSYVVYEDSDTIAILDIFPTKKGQTVVFPKKHTASHILEADPQLIEKTFKTSMKAAKILQEKLHFERPYILIQGVGVNHFHIKIYPRYMGQNEKINTTGPNNPASKESLKETLQEITG